MITYRPKNAAEHRNDQGVALIIALVMLLVLSTLAVGIVFVTQTQVLTSYNYRLSTQSRSVAEAGLQNAINWLVYTYTPPTPAQIASSYDVSKNPVQSGGAPVVLSAMTGITPNYPDATQQTNFNTALNNVAVTGLGVPSAYSVSAKLLRMKSFTQAFTATPGLLQTWEITSQGTLTTFRNAQTQVVETFERMAKPVFAYAAFATDNICQSLDFQSGGVTDSYDSSLGTYAATQQNTNGNVGTNGNLLNQSALTINGSLSTPWSSTYSGSCLPMAASSGNPTTATGGFQPLVPPTFPAPPVNPSPITTPLALNNTTLTPGNYGNASGACGNITFNGPGTYYFNSIDCSSNATFTIGPLGGPVIINVNVNGVGSSGYALNFQSGLSVNALGKPSNFQFVYGGTNGLNFQSGANPINALIYAPNSIVNFQSTGGFYGAMITKDVNFQSTVGLHYDRSLANDMMVQGSYYPVSFSWSKF